jgi:hypothetical protein
MQIRLHDLHRVADRGRFADVGTGPVARMEHLRNPGLASRTIPDCAIGPRFRAGPLAPSGLRLTPSFHALSRVTTSSKLQHGPQAQYRGILQHFSRLRSGRAGRAAAGMHEILEVRLQGPARADFVLIDRRHQRLGTPQRPARAHQLLKVHIQRACTGRDVGIARGDAELVLGARLAQADEFDAAIGIAVDQVSIRRTGRDAGEDSDAPIVVAADAIDFLLEHRIDAEISRQIRRHARTDGVGDRDAWAVKR